VEEGWGGIAVGAVKVMERGESKENEGIGDE
jgi:hypothetical protein